MGRAIGLILVGILAVILFAVSFTACSPQSGIVLAQVGQGGLDFQETAVADYIVIAGKITDPTSGKWLNNYTVIPYLNGEELSNPQNRAISRTGKYAPSGEGVHDGLFVLYIPNQYELTAGHDFISGNDQIVKMQYVDGGLTGASHLYVWMREVNPSDIFRLAVPDKQIEYAIAVMPQDNAELNPEYHQYSTTLDENGMIHKLIDQNADGKSVLIDPTETPPDTQKAITWTREYTAPENTNIWNTWKWYVENQVDGLDWNTYYENVLLRNPELAKTDYFVKGQIYYLPEMVEG